MPRVGLPDRRGVLAGIRGRSAQVKAGDGKGASPRPFTGAGGRPGRTTRRPGPTHRHL